jgi:Na+/melibiose symporter-like transporter
VSPAHPQKPANTAEMQASPSLSAGPGAIPQTRKPYTASTFQIHIWGATNISYFFQYQLFNPLVGLIFNLGFGMDPRIVGWALFFPRVIDAFLDPVVGHLSDITRTPWGRRRPFLFVCAILAAFLGIVLWRAGPDWKEFAQVAYLCVFVTLYFVVAMVFELTRNALSYELSDDYNIRSKIMAINVFWNALPQAFGAFTYLIVLKLAKGGTMDLAIPHFEIGRTLGIAIWLGGAVATAAWLGFLMLAERRLRTRCLTAGITLAALVVVPLVAFLAMQGSRTFLHSGSLEFLGYSIYTVRFPNLGSEVNGIRVVSMYIAGIIAFFGIVPTLFIKERFQNYNQKHVKLWTALKAAVRNRPFLVVILLRMAQTLGPSMYRNIIGTYLLIYLVCGGDKEQYAGVMHIGGAYISLGFTLLIWPLAAPLTRLIGKRWGLVLGFGTTMLSAIITPFITRPGWIWVIFWTNVFWMPWTMMQDVFFESTKPDICDLDELESGERREGLYSAVYSFINKLEISAVFLLGGYLLHWAGFDTKAASQSVLPSPQIINNLRWCAFTPLIFFAVADFVIAFFNPITPKVMERVHAELEARRLKSRVVAPELA